MLVRYLKADFFKTRHVAVRLAHFLIPIGTAVLFTIYYTDSPWNEYVKVDAYYQALGVALPTLIGTFCSMLSEQEHSAGGFQSMLMVQKKCIPFLSKLLVLLFLGLGALLLASMLFGVGFYFVLGNRLVALPFHFLVSFVLLGSSVFLYILHLFFAFYFNKGVSVGLGILESLVSALFLTDMGKYIWKYVPASWPARISSTFLSAYTGNADADAVLDTMFPVWAIFTLLSIVLYIIWASRWEGTKSVD